MYLENGVLFLLLPRTVVPAGPSLALSRNQFAGGSFRSVFSCSQAKAACGGAEEYFTTALLFTSLPPRNSTEPGFQREISWRFCGFKGKGRLVLLSPFMVSDTSSKTRRCSYTESFELTHLKGETDPQRVI